MRRSTVLLAAVIFAGCSDGVPPLVGPIPSTLIVNASQYTLLELRMHDTASYMGSANRLSIPLEVEDQIIYYGLGEQYVTVFREKFQDGPILAFTTATPMTMVRGGGYELTVFDESFRIASAPYIDPRLTSLPYFGDPGSLPRLDGGPDRGEDGGLDDADTMTSTIADAGTSTRSGDGGS